MIKITATNSEKHRIERLTKALRIAREMMALTEDQSNLLIESINDNRGTMTITWYAYPTMQQCAAFSTAWELVGESPDRALHALAVHE